MSHRMTEADAMHARYREEAWHKLGTVGHIDWSEARNAFDWCEVERSRLHIEHDDEFWDLGDRYLLKMVHEAYAYAEVSPRYQIVQHRFMIDDLTGILLDTGLVETIESVGTYDNGAVGYVSLKFKDGIEIPGWSHVDSIFNLGNGHDKNVPLIATQSATAVVCANTFKWNILDKDAVFRFRKVGRPQEMMEQAVKELCKGYERHTQYAAQIERMANQEFVDEQWDQLVVDLIGHKPSPSLKDGAINENKQGYYNKMTRWSNNKDDLNARFYRDEDIAGVRNTKWGALMAVQAWEQKDKPMKGTSKWIAGTGERNRRHQASVMFGKLPMTEKAAKELINA